LISFFVYSGTLYAGTLNSLLGRIFVFLSLALSAFQLNAAELDGVRVWRAPEYTRLVLDLSGPVEHTLFKLSGPDRLVIDIKGSSLGASANRPDLKNTPIVNLRYGQRENKDLRVVFDLKSAVKPRSFSLKAHAGKPDRLVIDLYDAQNTVVKTVPSASVKAPMKRDIVIAIDAGHGGEDPGALGPKGLKEKDVVYKISQQLERLISKEPGYKAVMVRSGDYYVPLKKRRNAARELRADLFVSIHADAFVSPKASGASVFALSRKGATSETARFLASKENEADLIGGVGGVSLEDKDDDVAKVLVDLSMTTTLANSLDVGSEVLKEIGSITKLHKKHVEQAGFRVLKSPDVPSILVESGFISNPGEAKKLNSRSHRKKLAKAIFNGIVKYFERQAPEDSLVWWKKQGGGHVSYTIGKGDTLSGIAKKYKTSVAQIKSHNRLKGERIRVGQVIRIPTS